MCSDPAAAQQAVRSGGKLREEEQETTTKTAEEHGCSQRGSGAASDPLREGEKSKRSEKGRHRHP